MFLHNELRATEHSSVENELERRAGVGLKGWVMVSQWRTLSAVSSVVTLTPAYLPQRKLFQTYPAKGSLHVAHMQRSEQISTAIPTSDETNFEQIY
jgi:hypothetical protein